MFQIPHFLVLYVVEGYVYLALPLWFWLLASVGLLFTIGRAWRRRRARRRAAGAEPRSGEV